MKFRGGTRHGEAGIASERFAARCRGKKRIVGRCRALISRKVPRKVSARGQ